MRTTIRKDGLVEIAVENAGSALHLIGTDSYTVDGKATVRADDVDKWEECPMPPYSKTEYEAEAARLIRLRYTADEEDAIKSRLLNALLHPEAATLAETGSGGVPDEARRFDEFYAYRLECLEKAKATLTGAAPATTT